jgi:hypothetical protein
MSKTVVVILLYCHHKPIDLNNFKFFILILKSEALYSNRGNRIMPFCDMTPRSLKMLFYIILQSDSKVTKPRQHCYFINVTYVKKIGLL